MAEVTLRGGAGARVDTETEVRRSRFLCRLVRVESENAARVVVEEARKEHWNARHHCSAFLLGSASAPDQVRRSNDDGEPSGTAGRPMLEALIGRNFVDTAAVVTRYFGGTLLGAGGLVRAYSDAVLTTIDTALARKLVVARKHRLLFKLPITHANAGRVEAELRQRGVTVLGTEYGVDAVLTLAGDNPSALQSLISVVTSGSGVLEAAGEEWVDTEI